MRVERRGGAEGWAYREGQQGSGRELDRLWLGSWSHGRGAGHSGGRGRTIRAVIAFSFPHVFSDDRPIASPICTEFLNCRGGRQPDFLSRAMSQSDNDGYNGLKAFAFTIGVTVLIFLILYASKRYNPNLFAQQSLSRSYSWYLRSADPPHPIPARRRPSLGEKPRIWDVWIASWCSHSRPALRKDEGADEKHDAADGEWAGFLVSCPYHSVAPPAHRGLSRYPATVCGQDSGPGHRLTPARPICTVPPCPNEHHHPHARPSSYLSTFNLLTKPYRL